MCNVYFAPFLLFCLGACPQMRPNSSPEVVQRTLFFEVLLVSRRSICVPYEILKCSISIAQQACEPADIMQICTCLCCIPLFVRCHGERYKASEVYKEVTK